jgi:glycine cleavage system regulatory protein
MLSDLEFITITRWSHKALQNNILPAIMLRRGNNRDCQHMRELLLITISGPDKPGLTAKITEALYSPNSL